MRLWASREESMRTSILGSKRSPAERVCGRRARRALPRAHGALGGGVGEEVAGLRFAWSELIGEPVLVCELLPPHELSKSPSGRRRAKRRERLCM